MKTLSPDTSAKVEQFHIELIRKSPVYRRLQIVCSLVKTTRQLSWQGILERYPEETQDARIERFISILYKDKSLAKKVKKYIAEKKLT